MNELDIDIKIDKEPYVKKITDDKVINVTGQSGSGKSTYIKKNYNNNEYIIVDTDDILKEKRYEKSVGINKELGLYFRKKYEILPNLHDDFDLIYSEILDYLKHNNKIIVIDCAQFHEIKDLNLLKGTVIVLRTSIDKCFSRCIDRWKKSMRNYTNEELEKYINKKRGIYTWYKYSNDFIHKIDKI